jgi:hypothetical protein
MIFLSVVLLISFGKSEWPSCKQIFLCFILCSIKDRR